MSDFMDAGQPHAALAAVTAAASTSSPCVHPSAHAQRLPLCCSSCRLSALFVRTSLSMLKAAYHLLDYNACRMVWPKAHDASGRVPSLEPAHPVLWVEYREALRPCTPVWFPVLKQGCAQSSSID